MLGKATVKTRRQGLEWWSPQELPLFYYLYYLGHRAGCVEMRSGSNRGNIWTVKTFLIRALTYALLSSSYHYWIAATTRLGAAESGIAVARLALDPARSWRDRLDLISDRSGGGVPSMQDGAHCVEGGGRAAPPDNIPFWKSDFSAVLAIFGALLPSFLPSFSFRSFVRSFYILPSSAQ